MNLEFLSSINVKCINAEIISGATYCGITGGGVAMSGSTVGGITTYVDADTICAQPNLNFNGSVLGVTGNIGFCNGTARCLYGIASTNPSTTVTVHVKGSDIIYYCDDTGNVTGGGVVICGGVGCNSDDSLTGCALGGGIIICAGEGCLCYGDSVFGGDVTIRGGDAIHDLGYASDSCGGSVNIYSGVGDADCGVVRLYTGNFLKFNTTVSGTYTTGVAYATTCMCSPIVRGATCMYSPIVCGATVCATTCLLVNQTNYAPVANVAAQFESTNTCEALRIYGYSGSTGNNVALRVFNAGGTSSGGNCAIYASAYYNTPSGSGRSHGIWAIAGNKTSCYNYGVIGQLCGTNDGAGIVGVLGGWSTTLPAGCWAGVFDGPTYLGGAVCATSTLVADTCICSPCICATANFNEGGTNLTSKYVRKDICTVSNSFSGNYLVFIYGGTNNDYIAYNDTTNAFYFNADDTTFQNTSANAQVNVGCLIVEGTTGYKICMTSACGCAVDWVATSDCRLKNNITPINCALSKINALCGVCYDFCEDGTPDMGLIAQEVEKVEPRLVAFGDPSSEQKEKYCIEGKTYGLKYDKFAGLFVEAIKELKEQNVCLQNQINALKEKLNN